VGQQRAERGRIAARSRQRLLVGVGADESRPEAVMNASAAISERPAVANWPTRIHHNSSIPLT
jgi:hypothetical protein